MKKKTRKSLEEREQEYESIEELRPECWKKLDKDQAGRSKVNHPEVEKDWYIREQKKRVI